LISRTAKEKIAVDVPGTIPRLTKTAEEEVK
jgi:hypothetical protein